MLPQERTAFLGVTVVAGCVQRLPRKQHVIRRTMCVMTAAAVHFAFPERMRIGFQCLATLLLVAVETNLWLSGCEHYRVSCRVALMTTGAGDGFEIMLAAMPRRARVGSVAIHALLVLFGDRCP